MLPLLVACTGSGDDDDGKDSGDAGTADLHDVILVLDNSGSMRENGTQLAFVVNELLAAGVQVGITTTTAEYTGGATLQVDPGEAGLLVGEPSGDVDAVRAQLLCQTIYWYDRDLASDPSYAGEVDECPLPEEVSREYLECVCPDGWSETEGSGSEEGLEAALDALCRAVSSASDACYDGKSAFVAGDEHTNTGLLRSGASTQVLIVTDEGDGSRRSVNNDSDIAEYLDAFDALGLGVQINVIGPPYEDNDGSCLGGASTWGVERYQDAARATGGVYVDLTEVDDTCTAREMGDLVRAVVSRF